MPDKHHMTAICPQCNSIMDDRAVLCKKCWLKNGSARRGTGTYPDFIVDGYVLCYKPEHPKASPNNGYVKRATLVWEEANKKPVPSGYQIHHKDNNRSNDIPSNLDALTSSDHCKITKPWEGRYGS